MSDYTSKMVICRVCKRRIEGLVVLSPDIDKSKRVRCVDCARKQTIQAYKDNLGVDKNEHKD